MLRIILTAAVTWYATSAWEQNMTTYQLDYARGVALDCFSPDRTQADFNHCQYNPPMSPRQLREMLDAEITGGMLKLIGLR